MMRWLQAGNQGEMTWLRDTAAIRADPSRLLRGAGTVLGLACCYATQFHRPQSPIAPYAQGRDYHAVVRDKLRALRRGFSEAGVACPVVFTCDTFPIHEKAWAERCGLGWIGKSGLLVTQDHGTRVVLATAILGDVPDRVATPIASRCGQCHRCIDACPTRALHGDKTLDARKCLAFHTIESRAEIVPEEISRRLKGRVFGCDVCQMVCPWNRVDHACDDPKFLPRAFAELSTEAWASITDDAFLEVAAGSGLKRAGAGGIRRNAKAALSGEKSRVNESESDGFPKGADLTVQTTLTRGAAPMEKSTFDPNAAALPDSGIFGLSHSESEAQFILIPVPFDATTSYRKGTASGPRAMVEASRQIDLFDLDLGRIYESGISLADENHWSPATIEKMNDRAGLLAQPIIDAGGLLASDETAMSALGEVNAICAEVNELLETEVGRLLDSGKIVGVIGGDHATPFGAMAAHAKRFPQMSLLHIDAHADLRVAFEGFTWSHASIAFNAVTRLPSLTKIVQVGVRDFCEAEFDVIQNSGGKIQTFFDASLFRRLSRGETWTAICEDISSKLSDDVYISFDIDGLSPDLCPNTGTPVPGGLSFNQINRLFEILVAQGHRIIGFDLVEVSPGQGGDEWDANVGARLLYKLIGWARRSRMTSKS